MTAVCSFGCRVPFEAGWSIVHEPGCVVGRFIPARAGNTSSTAWSSRRRTVHPRTGGEHPPPDVGEDYPTGSSPCGRGTQAAIQYDWTLYRFIPARAGNTAPASWSGTKWPVHPRAGGEHGSGSVSFVVPIGSSPRGRGTLRSLRARCEWRRFIPARAGNTTGGSGCPYSKSVHPRAGGEHLSSHPNIRRTCGSSPRGRGTPGCQSHTAGVSRFIPARAGNTYRARAGARSRSVHPRAGGEHSALGSTISIPDGSSPRGRGTLYAERRAERPLRFIPARAGNTRTAGTNGYSATVHPRAGGEHGHVCSPVSCGLGSSPRGRGTRCLILAKRSSRRFIPARAGNTSGSPRTPSPTPVHPRAGGEHLVGSGKGGAVNGSSPRGRGTLLRREQTGVHRRFIPARAGNTLPAT